MKAKKWQITILNCLFLFLFASCQILPNKQLNVNNKNPWDELKLGQLSSEIVTFKNDSEKLFHLTFNHLPKSLNFLELLDQYKVKATFFVNGTDIAKQPELIQEIKQRGHEIGNLTLNELTDFDDLSISEAGKQVLKPSVLLKELTNQNMNIIRIPNSDYPEQTLKILSAANFPYVINEGIRLKSSYFRSEKEAMTMVDLIETSNILTFDLQEDIHIEDTLPFLLEAVIKNSVFLSYQEFMNHKDTVKFPDYTDFIAHLVMIPDFESIIIAAAMQDQTVFSYAYTTKKYISLTFDGWGDGTLITPLLAALKRNGITATFFLPINKINENKELVKHILAEGHEIEHNTYSELDVIAASQEQIMSDLKRANDELVKWSINPQFVRAKSGKVSSQFIQAAAAFGLQVTTYSKNPQDRDMKSKQEIMSYLTKQITRGEIITLYADTNPAVIEVIDELAAYIYDIGYSFVSLQTLYKSQYNRLPAEQIAGYDKIKINTNIDNVKGTTISQVDTEKKVVFLTFDDWGTDKVVTSILDTLEKENVKASFFLRMKGAENNPNLAKAISDAGHDVSSHTFDHYNVLKLSKNALQLDLVKAHRALTYAIQRKPEMYFRPPQLEIDDRTARTIYATGYRSIILSQLSTHDWDPTRTKKDILDEVKEKVQPGSIIVLHLLDNATGWEVLPDLIHYLKKEGYALKKISDFVPQ